MTVPNYYTVIFAETTFPSDTQKAAEKTDDLK
jgi:hypothetical protein